MLVWKLAFLYEGTRPLVKSHRAAMLTASIHGMTTSSKLLTWPLTLLIVSKMYICLCLNGNVLTTCLPDALLYGTSG